MKQTSKVLTGIYTVFVLLDLLLIYLRENEMRWISKPILMPVLMLVFLFPHLQELKIPILVYSITIGVMLLIAMNTRQQLNHTASFLFIYGALFFVLSDSLLAINLFVEKHLVMSLGVMATYATAQYLIIKGALVS